MGVCRIFGVQYDVIMRVLALTTWLALLGSVGSAQVKWSLLQPSSLTDADRAQILDLAAGGWWTASC